MSRELDAQVAEKALALAEMRQCDDICRPAMFVTQDGVICTGCDCPVWLASKADLAALTAVAP